MARRGIKKMGAVLIAAGLSIAMCSPSVSANVRTNINTDKITQKKTARYVEPEEWNKEELTAYQFDSEVDMMKYLVSGGMHLYNKNYKGSDRWVKIKVADPGLFMVGVVSNDETKIPVYDASKKRIIVNNLNDGGDKEYVGIVKAGDEFYVKLPEKIDKVIILSGFTVVLYPTFFHVPFTFFSMYTPTFSCFFPMDVISNCTFERFATENG